MRIDSSFIIRWEGFSHEGYEALTACDMDAEEDWWRRENRRAKENWLGHKAYVDVGNPPRDYDDEREKQQLKLAMGYRISPAVWEQMKLQKAQRVQRIQTMEELEWGRHTKMYSDSE